MCYSAQVIELVRKFQRVLNIRLDWEEAKQLFLRRPDDPTINISRAYAVNFEDPSAEVGRNIEEDIDANPARLATKTSGLRSGMTANPYRRRTYRRVFRLFGARSTPTYTMV
jgi:hypothetical protein